MWYITFNDLHILNQHCTPGMNPTCSWCMILFSVLLVCYFFFFFRDFVSMFKGILYCNFLVVYLFSSGISVMLGIWKYYLLFNFLEELRRIGINSSLIVWQNSPVKPSWHFPCWEIFDYWFNLLTCYWSPQIFYFWFGLNRLYALWIYPFFSRLSNLLVYKCL